MILIAVGSLFAAALLRHRRPAVPPVAVAFAGVRAGGGIYRNPFGLFTITNQTARTVIFSVRGEAPLDPELRWSQGLYSSLGIGEVKSHSTMQMECLVAGKKGVPFRAAVHCQERSGSLVRAWVSLTRWVPLLKEIWNPRLVRVQTIYSEWYIALSDYEGPRSAEPLLSPRGQ